MTNKKSITKEQKYFDKQKASGKCKYQRFIKNEFVKPMDEFLQKLRDVDDAEAGMRN